MELHPVASHNALATRIALPAAFTALVLTAAAQEVPIYQPGAPGEPGRTLSAQEASQIAVSGYSPADVRFMQDMIPHHHQAVQMAALVADRTNNKEIIELAGRIDAAQADEIAFMTRWLEERGEPAPDPAANHAMHMSHEMTGMASPKEMADLESSDAIAFDRLFLTLMATHHEGALTMVEDLLEQPGSAYDPVLFEFVNDVKDDQTAEIERMNALLAGLSEDPRANLEPGFRDAGQAALNLKLIAALPKPAGFFDPENPAGVPPLKPEDGEGDGEDEENEEPKDADTGDEDAAGAAGTRKAERDDDPERKKRSPLLSFTNTDMAFSGNMMVAGSYHGFNVYKLDAQGVPTLFSSVVCPGGQGDVSIVGDLLIMSVEQTRGRTDCGLEGVAEDVSEARFRGLRLFDISDPARPIQVGQVQTCRGSHTHSVVSGPGEDGVIVVYNSGTSSVREEEELAGCIGDLPGDERTALFRIDVVEIPMDDPSKARIVASPAVFADPETGRLAGLWRGGDHGEKTQETKPTDECHDITVFPEFEIAAGACSGNGILFDISDPYDPRRIDAVLDTGFAYWHSATFNNDATKVIFTDEWGGGSRPRCRPSDPTDWGADALYDIVEGKLEFRSYYKIPAPQSDQENCVAHNGSIVPVPGRDIFVQAWYQGGLSVIDFTDTANPVEIAYFDRGPIDAETLVMGGYWSTYFYGGKIYGTEIARGLDVFALTPSEHLSANEIAAAALAEDGGLFNPQQQRRLGWPAEPAVARAYLDQLARSDALSGPQAADLDAALTRAETRLTDGGKDSGLADRLESLAAGAETAGDAPLAAARAAAFADTLNGIATRLR